MRNEVSKKLKSSILLHQNSKNKKNPNPKIAKQMIGILSFEVANIMSKIVHLYNSISDEQIMKLKNEIIKSNGIKKLVSFDESYLIKLAYYEILDDLNRIGEVVSRLGKKCVEPVLLGFEHVYNDLISGKIMVSELGFRVKDLVGMIKKFERYVGVTANLYVEFGVLNELEEVNKKLGFDQNVENQSGFGKKLGWVREDVRHLKDVSLWNRSFDKVVELLARTVCTLYGRICLVFGNAGAVLDPPYSRNRSLKSFPVEKMDRNFSSLRAQLSLQGGGVDSVGVEIGNVGVVMDPSYSRSVSFTSLSQIKSLPVGRTDKNFPSLRAQLSLQRGGMDSVGVEMHLGCGASDDPSCFGVKTRLTAYATPTTVGGSALALHYANVITVIEKFLCYPHLVGEDARDDLYQMLPTNLRKSLRINLKSHCKNLTIFDGALARDWKDSIAGILKWLAPLAHNMIRWQSEHTIEQQGIVSRTNVLLLQTLYFADREKTESAICQLLVGLNYVCRYEQQQNALLDCASSFEFGDWMEWQLQCQSSRLSR